MSESSVCEMCGRVGCTEWRPHGKLPQAGEGREQAGAGSSAAERLTGAGMQVEGSSPSPASPATCQNHQPIDKTAEYCFSCRSLEFDCQMWQPITAQPSAPSGVSRARDTFWVTLNVLTNEPPLVLTNAQRAVIQTALEAALASPEKEGK